MQYFIGQTRFSIFQPESKAWNVSQMSEHDYIKHLFSDERIGPRMDIFLNKSLPILQEMSEEFNYRHIVSYSHHLPEKWKCKLVEASNNNSVLFLHEVNSQNNPILTLMKDKPYGSLAYFRLDDDDLLSCNYLKQLSQYNKKEFKNMAVSFSKGYAAYYSNGRFSNFRTLRKNLLAIGLAYIGCWGESGLELPWGHSHHNLDEHIPVIIDSRKPVFFWTHHDNQDSINRVGATDVKEDLRKMKMVSNLQDILLTFPLLERDIDYFQESKNIFYSMDKMKDLLDSELKIVVCSKSEMNSVECQYEFELIDSYKSFTNGMLISFNFESLNPLVKGLMLSPNKHIGWYKYISFIDGVAKGAFSFDIEDGSKISSMKIVKWNKSISGVVINNLELSC